MSFKKWLIVTVVKETVREATLVVDVKAGITFLKNIIRKKYFIVFDLIHFPKERS